MREEGKQIGGRMKEFRKKERKKWEKEGKMAIENRRYGKRKVKK